MAEKTWLERRREALSPAEAKRDAEELVQAEKIPAMEQEIEEALTEDAAADESPASE